MSGLLQTHSERISNDLASVIGSRNLKENKSETRRNKGGTSSEYPEKALRGN